MTINNGTVFAKTCHNWGELSQYLESTRYSMCIHIKSLPYLQTCTSTDMSQHYLFVMECFLVYHTFSRTVWLSKSHRDIYMFSYFLLFYRFTEGKFIFFYRCFCFRLSIFKKSIETNWSSRNIFPHAVAVCSLYNMLRCIQKVFRPPSLFSLLLRCSLMFQLLKLYFFTLIYRQYVIMTKIKLIGHDLERPRPLR